MLNRTQDIFTHLTILLAVFWHMGLVLIPYNTAHLRAWGFWLTFGIWVGSSSIIAALFYSCDALLRGCFGCLTSSIAVAEASKAAAVQAWEEATHSHEVNQAATVQASNVQASNEAMVVGRTD